MTYRQELAKLDVQVSAWRQRLASIEPSWIELERAARVHYERARLSGQWGDYAAAESLLTDSFAVAPKGAGPYLTRAELNYTLHRFDRVEADLQEVQKAVLVRQPSRSRVARLRADLAARKGDFDSARVIYEDEWSCAEDPASLAGLANLHRLVGLPQRADSLLALLADIQASQTGSKVAWTLLQRGLIDLEEGRWNKAREHYDRAAEACPGWWLIEEHIAEVKALQGDWQGALLDYERVLAKNPDPEFMAAAAVLYRKLGQDAGAEYWIQQAKRVHRKRLQRFPEAGAGHYEEFLRAFESASE